MTKQQMARRLAKILGNGNQSEVDRVYRHQMSRPVAAVRESLSRWQAIDATPEAEIRRHCDVSFIR